MASSISNDLLCYLDIDDVCTAYCLEKTMKQDFAAAIVAPCDHKHLTCSQSNLRCAQSGNCTSDLKHLEPWQKERQTCYKDFHIDSMPG